MISNDDIEAMGPDMIKEIKHPGPGEMRGEGVWKPYSLYCKTYGLMAEEVDAYWEQLQRTGYLPTRIRKTP